MLIDFDLKVSARIEVQSFAFGGADSRLGMFVFVFRFGCLFAIVSGFGSCLCSCTEILSGSCLHSRSLNKCCVRRHVGLSNMFTFVERCLRPTLVIVVLEHYSKICALAVLQVFLCVCAECSKRVV